MTGLYFNMAALCFDLAQNIVINENEHKCHDTHMYSLYTTLRKKERKKVSSHFYGLHC